MELLGDVGHVKLVLVRLEIVLTLTQDMCIDCTEHTRDSKIILDAPNGTPRCRGSCGIAFKSVWREVLCRCKIIAQSAPNIP
jgi:hypothetical protein